MTRKLIDMYLCADGLPVHVSPLFKGYIDMNTEFENRDYRLTACHPKTLYFSQVQIGRASCRERV